jgi:hypothetical protein
VKKALASAAINAALLALPFLVLEGVFRLLPVAYLPQILPVSARTPVAHFQPNLEYRWSSDWNFSVVTRKRSNNYGFIQASDYDPQARSPLMAIIGDSLVEANQVDTGKSVADLLNSAVSGKGRVYSFGISGAPLSQYLVYAEFARKTFNANAMTFVIAPNDFDESLLKYKSEPRFHYFAGDGTLQRADYEISGAKKLLRHSAVLRYVMHNLAAGQRLETLWQSRRTGGGSGGEALAQRIADSYRAVDYFFEQLPGKSGLGADSIVFVTDPWRPAIYSSERRAQAQNGYYGTMQRYFAAQAAARGHEVIDLEEVFLRRYRLDGTRFEVAPTDSHWSALGHEVVAEQVRRSAVFSRTFPALPGFQGVAARRD